MKLNKGMQDQQKEYIVKSGKENKVEVSQMPVKHISPLNWCKMDFFLIRFDLKELPKSKHMDSSI